ncbi:hypothetical protein EAH82_07200 [Variovorax guangxiensis]|uniref:Polysaccharide biosynthesis protein n=2 Tax=Variovorax guangxiensis TaxID=1775474 RepID=A0A502DT92_9BURK|nr:hypothetical protein EAH82_07200 [Variovorax guangxiensis]
MVGGVESLGVILGGVAGLLIVNFLPKEQYAAYTFLITCMTLMLGITDTGLAHCCLPLVGQRTTDVPWVVGACRQVFRKRGWLLAASFLIVVPYWIFSSRQHGWSGGGYWLASAVVVLALLMTLREHYAQVVLLILGHIGTLNRTAFMVHGVRMSMVAAALFLLPTSAYSLAAVLGAAAVASFAGLTLLQRSFKANGIAGQPPLPPEQAAAADREIFRIAKPLVLPAIFYQFQGVITVFIVSLFGTSAMLAEVGALGRIAMMLVVFDRVAAMLLFPVIARAPDGERLATMVVRAHLAYVGIMSVVFLSALLLPDYWILLLGKQYAAQAPVLWMAFLSTLLMNSAGFAFSTLVSRGHTVRQTYIIPFVLLVQVSYLAVFGVADLRAVLGFGVATCMSNALYQYAMLIHWFRHHKALRDA